MPRSILAPFKTFSPEAATVGRLLAGYSNIEVSLMHAITCAQGSNLDIALKGMFRKRGETKRINAAETLGHGYYKVRGLGADFQKAVRVVRHCLNIRNQYAHWVWWDDKSGQLAFANLEDLARRKRPVRDLLKLKAHHVDATLLAAQEAYFVYADDLLSWLNYESRFLDKKIPHRIFEKPKGTKKPRLRL